MTDVTTTNFLDPVADLHSISLGELAVVADLQTRTDRKYLLTPGMANELLAEIAPAVRVLTIDDARTFRYESVYFDTPALASYLGAARRRPRRFKVRTRSYLDSGTCHLEIKTRDPHGRTVKHRLPYQLADRHDLTADGRQFVGDIDQAADAADLLAATLTTTYRRTTLALRVGDARVTVDVDLECHDPRGNRVCLPELILVETKTPGPACAVDRALWRAGRRPVTISKYCTGLAALHPYLPANKWNRVLRRHFGWHPAKPALA